MAVSRAAPKENKIVEATRLFKKMVKLGCRPSKYTCSILIQGLCKIGNASIAVKLHEEMTKRNSGYGIYCQLHQIWYNTIIDGLCKDRMVEKARELFSEMKDAGILPDVYAYNSLILGLCYDGKWKEADGLFTQMVDQGVRPNVVTFNVLIDVLCLNGNMQKAYDILELMIRSGENLDSYAYTSLITGFCIAGRFDEAKELFLSIPSKGCEISNHNFCALINGYCKKWKTEEATNLFREIVCKGVRPSVDTYNALLTGIFQEEALKLFHNVKNCKFGISIDIFNSPINGLCKSVKLEIALELFNQLPRMGLVPNVKWTPDIVTYNTLMRGFLENSELSNVVELLHKMAEKHVLPGPGEFLVHVSVSDLLHSMVEAEEKKVSWSILSQSGVGAVIRSNRGQMMGALSIPITHHPSSSYVYSSGRVDGYPLKVCGFAVQCGFNEGIVKSDSLQAIELIHDE
ncbi:hypothetical protein FEM48_Zijuj03G0050900 [Ziziphus jujuba var. spinosa]|uniref:Uncharacterized protein n=1 Tax=Ziziphus jujuba var. spinosa TaxID=714518 RepID=A0A978VNC3_ZIZJJ|nr:hypothetical protein FEM48_Zijuj03G0050900 [Ziziphus jujuba var. spinosa]